MGGEGTHTKSGARERGFPARTEGRKRSEARPRKGDGREKKLTNPAKRDKNSPDGANRCADGGAHEGATTEPTVCEGCPPDRP